MSSDINWLEFFQDRQRLHADYYLDFAQQHARREAEAYEQLETESGNLLKIAAWLAEQNESEGVLKLASALWEESDFLRTRGFMGRGLSLLEQAHQVARRLGNSQAEFIWLEALAYVHTSKGNLALAQPLYKQALVLAQEINEPKFRALAQLEMGRLLLEMGQLDQAAAWLKQALCEYRHDQDYKGEIETLTALGNLLSLQGDSDGAVGYLEEGLPIVQAQQDRQGEVALRFALGYVGTATRDWPRAIMYYEPVIEMARTIGDRFLEVRGLHNLGEAWLEQGDVQKAVAVLEEAIVRQETLDDVVTKTFTHFYLGKAYQVLNDPENSLAQLRQIYPYLLETRHLPILAALATETVWLMANNYLKQNNINAARKSLYEVLDLTPNPANDFYQAAKTLLKSIDLLTDTS